MSTTARSPFAFALAAALLSFGCSSSEETKTTHGTTPTNDAGTGGDTAPGDDAAPAADPLYLVHSAIQNTEGRTNYFTVVDGLDQARKLEYSKSIEIPGRARLYAAPGIGFFAIGDGEDVSITRFELGADGALVAGAKLSLQAYGVTAMGAQAVHFVSATKAYYKDDGQAQVIVWNPTEMTIDKAIPLPADLVKTGYLSGVSQWATRDGEAYFAVSHYTKEYDRVLPGTTLVRFDTTNDTMTVTPDTRCRGLGKTARVGDTLYFFSDVINGLGHAVYPGDAGQQDCILRISKGKTGFDGDYVGSIAPALGDKIGTVVTVSPTGEAWAQVIDPAVMPTKPGTKYSEWYAGGWGWWHLKLDTLSDAKQAPGEAGAYSGFIVGAGPGFFVSQTKADYSETTLVDLSGDAPKSGLSFPGFALDIARVR